MAVLVFLAGTARAGLIAANLAPGGLIHGVAVFRCDNAGCKLDIGSVELVLSGGGVDVMSFHTFRQVGFRGRCSFTDDFHPHQLCHDGLAQIGEQCLKQLKRFGLVFL